MYIGICIRGLFADGDFPSSDRPSRTWFTEIDVHQLTTIFLVIFKIVERGLPRLMSYFSQTFISDLKAGTKIVLLHRVNPAIIHQPRSYACTSA